MDWAEYIHQIYMVYIQKYILKHWLFCSNYVISMQMCIKGVGIIIVKVAQLNKSAVQENKFIPDMGVFVLSVSVCPLGVCMSLRVF